MGRYLGSARNAVWGTSGDLELVCNEAVLTIGERNLLSTSPSSFCETCNCASKYKSVDCCADDANAGSTLNSFLCGGDVADTWRWVGTSSQHGTESGEPLVTLNLCVMRRYCLGEGDLVSTLIPSMIFALFFMFLPPWP